MPWQYVDMPRGQVLLRSTFNARVAAAVRIVQEKREAVMPSPRTPDDARQMLTSEPYTRAWHALQELPILRELVLGPRKSTDTLP